ncbi:MAG: DNA polymerase III subunit delta [Deltaproteobacteria bacterium]|nr:MAG: DNA polymerase III subunit delta [Deltaproteobacteria bacterium]
MGRDLSPEIILTNLEASKLPPYSLFYGPSEFLKENLISKLKRSLLESATAEFNLQIFYADESTPEEVLEAARSLPFMSERRVVIVRRTESYKRKDQEKFLPYLDAPVTSTFLLFVTSSVEFHGPLLSSIRKAGYSVYFAPLKENRVVPWLRSMAKDMELNISPQACAYLHQIVGNSLMELHAELEKLSIRYGDSAVGIAEVREMASKTRAHSIFELVESVTEKDCPGALRVLHELLAQEGKDSVLAVVGMLNRQLRLLWQVKSMKGEGKEANIPEALGIPPFIARKLINQADEWTRDELRKFLESLYMADSALKSGSRGDITLDYLIVSLCREKAQEEIWFTRR